MFVLVCLCVCAFVSVCVRVCVYVCVPVYVYLSLLLSGTSVEATNVSHTNHSSKKRKRQVSGSQDNTVHKSAECMQNTVNLRRSSLPPETSKIDGAGACALPTLDEIARRNCMAVQRELRESSGIALFGNRKWPC